MDAIVLAAGAGTRMHPLTLTRPKALLSVAGRPLLAHVLERAVAAGASRLHVVVHHGAGQVRGAFKDAFKGVPITYHDQGEARGTGHALAAIKEAPAEPFLLLSGDTIVGVDDLERLARSGGDGASIVGAHKAPDPRPYGVLEARGDTLVRIHEKRDDPPGDLVNTGTYLLQPDILDTVRDLPASARGEIELTDAVNEHAREGRVRVLRMAAWTDVGRPWDLLEANRVVLEDQGGDAAFWTQEGTVEEGVRLEGPVRVEADAVVRTGTVIEGPVVIAAGARVGPMAYLRASTTVGRRCHVGAHTEIKNSVLFDDANAPHLNYVGDSVIGAGVNLGAGTMIANLRHDGGHVGVDVAPGQKVDSRRRKLGAVIGDHVKTGINVSLDCGTVIGPGALLAPGEPFRGHLEGDRIHYAQGKSGPRKRARTNGPANG